MNRGSANPEKALRPRRAFVGLAAVLTTAFLGFLALGAWQLQRMQWKHDLIERVEARVDAAPVPIPARERWASVDAAGDEYRRVRISGVYLPGAEVRTQALTELGGGFWVLSALRAGAGEVVFVNRGFVPEGVRPGAAPSGPVTITGLLRISEPGGGFLRRNNPATGRWYSRDIAAIARALGLPTDTTAPFFIDAGPGPVAARDTRAGVASLAEVRLAAPVGSSGRWPREGLTVVRFRNSHLSYALTWFALAALTAWAGLRLWRMDRRRAGPTAGQETDA